MDFIKWSDDLSCGNIEVDRQHRALVDGIQNLLTVVSEDTAGIDGSDAQKKAMELLAFLEKYVLEHFEYEEAVMEKYDCHVKDLNAREHELFVYRLVRLKKAVIEHGFTRGNIMKLETLLCHWLVHHILNVDKELSKYVEQETIIKSGLLTKLWKKLF